MKKVLPVLFGLLCMPAFAEVAPVGYWDDEVTVESPFYDENPEVVSTQAATPTVAPAAPIVKQPALNARAPVAARTAARAVPAVGTQAAPRAQTTSRAVASRNAATSIRSMANTGPEKTLTTRTGGAGNVNVARSAGLVQTDTINSPLYNPTSSRVGVRGSAIGQLSATRMAGTPLFGATSTPVDTGTSMEELAQLTDFCRAQYFVCMDNFCDILDDNQGRCSCSGNITAFKKSEDALKQATEELQEVAIKIQYLGLTRDEVISLFSATEAEQAMANTQDTTQLKNDLDKIRKLVLDVKGGSSTGFEAGFLDLASLDLNFGDGFDLNALFGMGSSTISNQRGAELFKTASTRCKSSVLDTCKKQGVDTALITNGYDLEIDKQCIQYERALEDSNTQMRRTVRNATVVLQKARLVVAQNRNAYDMRGCVNALDSCMQSDGVCGPDYELCLDPTGKFIVNGEVIPGSNFSGTGFTSMWGEWMTGGTLSGFINSNINNFSATSNNMVSFLVTKIGNNVNGRDTGMCMSVLNRCQNYSFTGTTAANKRYDPSNQVVREYLTQALTRIKARQDNIIAEYSSGCKSDVQSCLITNGAMIGSSGLDIGFISNSIANACKAVVNSCSTSLNISNEELVQSIACFTADSLDPGTSVAWTVNMGGTQKQCICPKLATWSSASRSCNCPTNTSWRYETGTCDCTDENAVTGSSAPYCTSCQTGYLMDRVTGSGRCINNCSAISGVAIGANCECGTNAHVSGGRCVCSIVGQTMTAGNCS